MNNILNFNQFQKLNEGTWSLPDSVDKANKLVELLKADVILKTKAVETLLYDVLGSDGFFDNLHYYNENDNIKPTILSEIENFLKHKKFHMEKNAVEPKAIEILETLF